jgi:hypothetical protein
MFVAELRSRRLLVYFPVRQLPQLLPVEAGTRVCSLQISFDDASLREGFVSACVYLNADHGELGSEIGPDNL